MEAPDLEDLDVHPDVLPIYPDDDAPVREGYKVRLPGGTAAPARYAYFPDSTYGSAEGSLRAADTWCRRGAVDDADTRNVVRIEIAEKTEERTGRSGAKRLIKARRSTRGWQVRMQRQGVTYTQFFNDNHFGGRLGALAAAHHWRDTRDATLTRISPATALDRSRASRSQCGVPGLRLLVLEVGNGRFVPYLQASWPETGPGGQPVRKRKTLSLEKHDPREVTARLCQMLVEERGREALPAEGLPARAGRVEVPEPVGLGAEADASERAVLLETFAEAYRRAWPFVRKELPALRRKARDQSAAAQETDAGSSA